MSLKEGSVFYISEDSDHLLEETNAEVKQETNTEVKVEEVKVEEVKVEEVKVEEVKVEELEEVFLDLSDKTLSEIITLYNKNKNYYVKKGIQIKHEEIDILEKIISKTPLLLDEIEKSVLNVIKNNNINTDDFPEFVIIVQILYERLDNLKDIRIDNNKLADVCSTILKILLHTLVEERKINIEDENKTEFLSKLDKLIDSCVNLIKFPNILQTKKCCTIC